MADSDMTPFDQLRDVFGMSPDETKIDVVSPDGLTQIQMKLIRVEEPHGETLTLVMLQPDARRVPRVDIPKINQTELNGRVRVIATVAGRVLEDRSLIGLAFQIGLLSSLTGFSTPTLALLRQAGGDPEFAGYFERM